MSITTNNNNESTSSVATIGQNGVVPYGTATKATDHINNTSDNKDVALEEKENTVPEEETANSSEQQQQELEDEDLVWYFSYGSNLNPVIFEEKRKIKCRDYRVCKAPGYVLTYTESILPFIEPAFCTCVKRCDLPWKDQYQDSDSSNNNEASSSRPDIHGVAFLITRQQYEHMLLTEGGWGYQEYRHSCWDIGHYGEEEIECVEIETDHLCCEGISALTPRPNRHFRALTLTGLFGDRQLADANASKRYVDIVNKGAESSGLPASYREYLRTKHPAYEPTNCWKAKLALKLYLLACLPVFVFEFGSLHLCILWNERKMKKKETDGNNSSEEDNKQEQPLKRRKRFEGVVRPPWIVLKLCFWYRNIVLERMMGSLLFDWCKFPNGFRNPCAAAAAAAAAAEGTKKTQ